MAGHSNPRLIGKNIIDKNGRETVVYVLPPDAKHTQPGLPFGSLADLASDTETNKQSYVEDPYRYIDNDPTSRYSTTYDVSHEIVRQGHVVDVLRSDGTLFFRSTENVEPRRPTRIRLQANRVLTENDVKLLTSLVGYASSANTGKKVILTAKPDTNYSFVLDFDIWKNMKAKRDISEHIESFENDLKKFAAEGTPVRKTNRSGPNTQNTRLIDGFNEPEMLLEIYYDDVYLKDEDLAIIPDKPS